MLPEGRSFNLELSIPARCDDAFYMQWKEIPERSVQEGVYLRTLGRREIIAQQLYSLSLVWEKRKNLTQAAAALEEALELSPLFPDALNLRGLIRKKEGLGGEALDDFDLALLLDPCFAEARFNRDGMRR